MLIRNEDDIDGLRTIGRIVARTLQEMARAIEPGVTTAELDAIGARLLAQAGARSAPRSVYSFPGETCISVNEEAAHGIPGERMLKPGDIINIDVSAERDGYFGDTGATFIVPPAAAADSRLVATAEAALQAAMAAARAGERLNVIGHAIETTARTEGFRTLRDLGSHGVGRSLHEAPRFIPNYLDPSDQRRLDEGRVITIEPFISTHSSTCRTAEDGWTLISGRGNRSAQFEHTMIIRCGAPEIMTLP